MIKTWQRLRQNPELFRNYFAKEYTIKACRRFFEHRGYHELESPILAFALPQERYISVLEVPLDTSNIQNAYIIPTTETYNKKILAAGIGEHFVITKVCRGVDDIGPNHSPEFTMLEWYHLDTDYRGLMQDTEALIIFIKKYINAALIEEPTPHEPAHAMQFERVLSRSYEEIDASETSLFIEYQDHRIDLSPNWPRISVPDALQKYAHVKLENIIELDVLKLVMKQKGYTVNERDDWEILFEQLFANEIEPNFPIDRPIFVYDYPKLLCPLVQTKKDNPLVCEKVELYIAGKELANGYTELLDWQEQEKRFLEEQQGRKELGFPPIRFDHDLVEALKAGLPQVGGIGMGLDRLVMILMNAKTINEVNYFPLSEEIE